jgi:hypothetical protein
MKQLWRHLPRIKYNAPPAGADDFFSNTFKAAEAWFKLVGWCLIIGTLHYGYVKTNSLSFSAPEAALTGVLAFLVYGYFMRFIITLPKGQIIAFNAGRPAPFHRPSLVAMLLVMGGARVLISHWVDAVVALQAK